MIDSPPDEQRLDFLEVTKAPDRDADITSLAFSSQVLLQILREIKKAHPSQRCIVDAQFSSATKVLDSSADFVDIRFLAQGKPVLAQYVVISNNTNSPISVGINEPVIVNAANTFATGIMIAATEPTLQLPVEIEKIQIRVIAAGPGLAIPVNNSTQGVPVAGQINVYGWTIPHSDKDATE